MFLDTFIENSSECIDLVDLELECTVSLEAAYNDAMLEACQLKYQAMVEGVSVINEGVIDSIKNFFKKLLNAIKKFFGFSSSSGGGGSASPSNIGKLKKKVINDGKKIAAGLKYILNHPELNDKYKIIDPNTFFPQDVDIESCLQAAIENTEKTLKNFKKELESSNDVDADGDKIALDALRTFINKIAMESNLIVTEEINSLDDFKKILNKQIKYTTLKDYYTNKDFNKVLVDAGYDFSKMLDELEKDVLISSNYRAIVEKQMKKFEDKVLSQANEWYPQFANIALKSANILTRACIIGANYSRKVMNEMYRTTLEVIVAAGKIHINE